MITYMDPDLIKSVKMAALDREIAAFQVMEQAVRLWLHTQANPKPERAAASATDAGSAAASESADETGSS